MKKKLILSITLLVIVAGLFCHFQSETIRWILLPDYNDAAMEGYVYLTPADNNYVYISYTVYYDNTGLEPVLYNEDSFTHGINKILESANNSTDDIIKQPESSKLYLSYISRTDVYHYNDEKQLEQLQDFIQNFNYQFALKDSKTATYTYKLNKNFTLQIIK